MSILLSGDFHNNVRGELDSITAEALIAAHTEEKYAAIKYHIILGDAGFLWPGGEITDGRNYARLAERPFPVLAVMGNHEPVYGRSDLPEADIGIGETVILVRERDPFVAYLKRGKVYRIEGHDFLVLGGALSIDKMFRTQDVNWWENEYWSEQETEDVFALIKQRNTFDYVLSHTGPHNINKEVFSPYISSYHRKHSDKTALLNEEIDARITYRQWFCGHWHADTCYRDEAGTKSYHFLYRDTLRIE